MEEAVVRGLEIELFLILPHPEVADYFCSTVERNPVIDSERWCATNPTRPPNIRLHPSAARTGLRP